MEAAPRDGAYLSGLYLEGASFDTHSGVLNPCSIGHFAAQPLRAVQEVDCLRVVGKHSCVLVQRVPACTESISISGSEAPAAMLCAAYDSFTGGDVSADEEMRSVSLSSVHISSAPF